MSQAVVLAKNVIGFCSLHTEDKETEKENGVNISMTSQYKQNKPSSDDQLDQVFIAFARVFSGTVKKGQKLYVLGPKHDPAKALQKVGSFMPVIHETFDKFENRTKRGKCCRLHLHQ